MESMARRLRLQYPGAIYHLMARGNGRQEIVSDDADRDRLQEHLGKAAIRCSWRVYAFAIMSNHLHIVLKTPQPNLARGMQAFLSGYANAWARRHKFSGHVFQGRYRTELVEDETYLWTVTRYVHLNPVRAKHRGAPGGLGLVKRRHTLATNTDLAAVLGLSRAESVPNLTRRFSDWLSTDVKIRKQFTDLEAEVQRA